MRDLRIGSVGGSPAVNGEIPPVNPAPERLLRFFHPDFQLFENFFRKALIVETGAWRIRTETSKSDKNASIDFSRAVPADLDAGQQIDAPEPSQGSIYARLDQILFIV